MTLLPFSELEHIDFAGGTHAVIEQIKAEVHNAAGEHHKIATFHYQVLKNAEELEGIDPKGFCKEISVPGTYATEFRKMLALARLMKEKGAKIVVS